MSQVINIDSILLKPKSPVIFFLIRMVVVLDGKIEVHVAIKILKVKICQCPLL